MISTVFIVIAIVVLICFTGALVVHITDNYGTACGSAAAIGFVTMCVLVGLFMLKGALI